MRKIKIILTIFLLFVIYVYVSYLSLLPKNIFLIKGEQYSIKQLWGIDIIETIKTSNNNTNQTNLEITLFGKIPIKEISVTTIENVELVPVGKIIGLKMYTNGVLVVGMTELENINNNLEASFEEADIQAGDTILKINETEIEDIEVLKKVVNNSDGEKLNLTILRNGSIINTSIKPIETEIKEYKLGLWVKDAATGVGTMTFYVPDTRRVWNIRTWNN